MKLISKLILYAILIVLNIQSQTPVEKYGDLQVIGANLCDSAGNPIQLRGLSTHGLQYFNEIYEEDAFASIAQNWNADVIRLANYVNEGWGTHGNYLNYSDYWKSRIDTLVNYAVKYNIYVIIDWHMLVPGDPNAYLNEAKDFWTYMSMNHGNKDNVLFEICNEPNNDSTYDSNWNSISYVNGVTWKNNIKKYAEEILPIIRNNSDNVVLVGTENWALRPDLVIGEELSFDNVMYSTHFYAGDHKENYLNYLKIAIDSGLPLFVTEFGTQKADGNQENDFNSSDIWLNFLDSNKISWVNWNFSNDFRSGAVFKKDASLNSLESYSDTSNMKEAGIWIYKRLRNDDVSVNYSSDKYDNHNISYRYNNGTIKLNRSNNDVINISMFNISGKKIFENEFTDKELLIKNISNGVYILKLRTKTSNLSSIISIY